jgi:hypothetical protein
MQTVVILRQFVIIPHDPYITKVGMIIASVYVCAVFSFASPLKE